MGRLKLVSVTNSRRGNDDGALSYGAQKDLLLHDTGPIMVGERVIHLAGTGGQWVDNARMFDRFKPVELGEVFLYDEESEINNNKLQVFVIYIFIIYRGFLCRMRRCWTTLQLSVQTFPFAPPFFS